MIRTFAFAAAALVATGTLAVADDADTRDLSAIQSNIVAIAPAHSGKLKVTAWTDPDHKGVYKIGEPVHFFVRANQEAYFSVFWISPTGQSIQLFPNQFQASVKVPSKTILEIPGKNAPSQIVASGNPEVELIRVVASTKPLTVVPETALTGTGAYREIAGGAAELARGLAVVAADQTNVTDHYDTQIKTVPGAMAAVAPAPTPVPAPASAPAPAPSAETSGAAPVLLTDKQSYKIGDTLTIAVTPAEDCHLWVLDVSSDHTVVQLFPNKWAQQNLIAAKQTVFISGASAPAKVVAGGPAGQEAIYALCGKDATSPWDGGMNFAAAFPQIDANRGLAKALIVSGVENAAAVIPPGFTSAQTTLAIAQ